MDRIKKEIINVLKIWGSTISAIIIASALISSGNGWILLTIICIFIIFGTIYVLEKEEVSNNWRMKTKISLDIEIKHLHGDSKIKFLELERIVKKKLEGFSMVSTIEGMNFEITKCNLTENWRMKYRKTNDRDRIYRFKIIGGDYSNNYINCMEYGINI